MQIGDLVRYWARVPISPDDVGLVIRCLKGYETSDILWSDGITTCDWEDLEVVNESHSI